MHDGSSMHGGVSSSFFAAYNEGKIIDGMPQLSIPVIGLFSKKSDYETLLRNLIYYFLSFLLNAITTTAGATKYIPMFSTMIPIP